MILPCLFCDPVASSCCIDSVRKPTGIQTIVKGSYNVAKGEWQPAAVGGAEHRGAW